MAVNFDWSYFWSYYSRIGYPNVQKKMREEILADDWLFDQPAEVQVAVLKSAPSEFVEGIKARLKPDTIKSLTPSGVLDWSEYR